MWGQVFEKALRRKVQETNEYKKWRQQCVQQLNDATADTERTWIFNDALERLDLKTSCQRT